ncbi:MAG: AdeC/AdeK/OprM family multidrug efflux complex outer membrane factor [Pigmentiphaga sp.]|uniref:AdeC/AdeK/OprM family multidrug efflux complex outer membrane factor n=1 Tax=Pigmentiphaga sp. TaxID=1977564 RepID=UPI0029BA58F1|nr:AdeC/AdeK/OprM family multidrug efflux complex outer membrane factor [Pigmentiphaga sp.]MDX3908133.1 AdeC/AdeK/OprM family multidrug efflux complex outer membrane factor [Pigmentiphaga sp.]
MSKKIVALAAAALLGGCSLIPSYERPAAPVESDFAAHGAAPAGSQQAAADIGWRQFFGDARLQRLIALALENNRDLRVAVLNIEAARAQYGVTRADQFPGVSANANGTRQRTPADLSLSGRQTIGSQYQVNLGVTAFELDLFGRVRSLSEAALAQYLATEETRRSTQISLVAQLANAYLNERASDEALALAQRTLKTRQDSYNLIKMRYDAGAASELELQQAESLVQNALSEQAIAERNRALAINTIVLLIGQPLPADLPAPRPLDAQALLAEVPVGLSSDLIERRPDIRAAEQQLLSANANIGAARAAFFPRIALTGAFGTASSQLSGLFDSGSLAWSFMPQISLPIFDAGRNRANLDLTEARRNIAVAQYEKTIQTAFREVADALDAKRTYDRQIEAQQQLVDASRRSLELSELRYRNGVDSYLQLLDAQRALFTAEQGLLQARAERLNNLVNLYKSLGGGWEENTVAAAPTPTQPTVQQ